MVRYGVLLVFLSACGGGPVLQNLPRPNPAVVAGIAAATAGAATLADPQAAARKQGEKDAARTPDMRGNPRGETIPADVFDRLDEAEQRGEQPPAPAAPAPAAASPDAS